MWMKKLCSCTVNAAWHLRRDSSVTILYPNKITLIWLDCWCIIAGTCCMLEWKSKASIISNEFATAAASNMLLKCHVQWATKDSVKVSLKSIELQKTVPDHIRHIDRVHAKTCIKQAAFETKCGSDLWNEWQSKYDIRVWIWLYWVFLTSFLWVSYNSVLSKVFNYWLPICLGPQIPMFSKMWIEKIHDLYNGLQIIHGNNLGNI